MRWFAGREIDILIICVQVAEAALMDVRVEGSLLVHADSVMGSMEAPWEAAAAAASRNSNDIHVSHPNGSQTLYPADEPGADSQAAPHANHSSGAPLFSEGRLHLQVYISALSWPFPCKHCFAPCVAVLSSCCCLLPALLDTTSL